MRRSFAQILRQESPVLLAREALWRTRKGWRKKWLLRLIHDAHCPVKFRDISYYANRAPNLSEKSKLLITGYADKVGQGYVPFLGYGTHHLGREPNWMVDFVSSVEWPGLQLNQQGSSDPKTFDIKVPWELSRLQFLPVLGKAHIVTGKERYREDAKRLTSDWIAKNPVGVGVNWSIAMEAALRAMSICFLLNLLSPFRQDEQNWLQLVTRCLWQHLLFIEAHMEFSHLISSNHYLSNVIGLYCLSEFLDGVGMPARRRMYRQKVESEILRQVYEDGGDYEASIGYHVLVTQMFTSAFLLMRAANSGPHPEYVERLQRMYTIIQTLASSTGQLPHVGDCDDGRVELLLDDLEQMLLSPVHERNSLRISNLLGVGSWLFGNTKGKFEDARWYTLQEQNGADSSNIGCTESITPEVMVFRQSGMSVVRKEDAEVLFFAIPNGIHGKGSHNHNDKLSFILRLGGEEVLCDSGTCTYTRDPGTRNRFRGTAAHNTVIIDGQEQNTFEEDRLGLFSMGNESEVSPIDQVTGNQDLILRAYHTGYRRFGVTHTRTLRLRAKEKMTIIEDQLDGNGTHDFEINFQLAPRWKITLLENRGSEVRARVSGSRDLQIVFRSPDRAQAQSEDSSISMTYGALLRSQRLRIQGKSTLPVTLLTIISWRAKPRSTGDETSGGRLS